MIHVSKYKLRVLFPVTISHQTHTCMWFSGCWFEPYQGSSTFVSFCKSFNMHAVTSLDTGVIMSTHFGQVRRFTAACILRVVVHVCCEVRIINLHFLSVHVTFDQQKILS